MFLSRDVTQFEIKQEDCCDLSIHRSIRLDVWVINHTLDVFCVDFYYQVFHTNYPNLHVLQSMEETKQFQLHL
jgi:hypothetical protein